MDKAILVIHVLVALSVVALVLVQRSNTDGGAAFGGGSQNSLLGTVGSAPLLTKITVGLVAVFFITSLSLAYMNRHYGNEETILIPAAESVSDQDATQNVTADSDIPQVTVTDISEEASGDIPTASDDLPQEK